MNRLSNKIYILMLIIMLGLGGLVLADSKHEAQYIEKVSERIVWDKKPISLKFTINQERIIHFPKDVRYWLPDTLKSLTTVMSANGVIYFTAHKSFEKTRIRIQEIETQAVYLLDVSSSEEGYYPEEVIILNKDYIENKSKQVSIKKTKNDWYIRLARFAAQSLYAPERLIPSDGEIYHIEVDSTKAIPLVRGGYIESIPIDSWKGGGYYVTAVLIKNTSSENILIADDRFNKSIKQLDVLNDNKERILFLNNDIRGDWLAVVPQHTTLSSIGTDDNKTCLYVISKQSFMESL